MPLNSATITGHRVLQVDKHAVSARDGVIEYPSVMAFVFGFDVLNMSRAKVHDDRRYSLGDGSDYPVSILGGEPAQCVTDEIAHHCFKADLQIYLQASSRLPLPHNSLLCSTKGRTPANPVLQLRPQ